MNEQTQTTKPRPDREVNKQEQYLPEEAKVKGDQPSYEKGAQPRMTGESREDF